MPLLSRCFLRCGLCKRALILPTLRQDFDRALPFLEVAGARGFAASPGAPLPGRVFRGLNYFCRNDLCYHVRQPIILTDNPFDVFAAGGSGAAIGSYLLQLGN
jgi:hypothetical protein